MRRLSLIPELPVCLKFYPWNRANPYLQGQPTKSKNRWLSLTPELPVCLEFYPWNRENAPTILNITDPSTNEVWYTNWLINKFIRLLAALIELVSIP